MSEHKVVYGIIGKSGGREEGQGFSCQRKEKGEYKVQFNSKFKANPAITATAEHTELGQNNRKVLNVVIDKETESDRRSSFTVLIQTADGRSNDNRFHFIAVAEG